MKKKLSIIIALAMILTLVAGCKGDEDTAGLEYELPEFAYLAETLQIPDIEGDIRTMTYSGDRLYFVTNLYISEPERLYFRSEAKIYSMSLDGTDFKELPGYTPSADMPDITHGSNYSYVNGLNIDGDGNIWIAEQYNCGIYNLPEGMVIDPEKDSWEYQEYYEELESGNFLRKLDASTGAEMASIDLKPLQGTQDYFSIADFEIDNSGNIYLLSWNYNGNGMIIYVLDGSGNKQFDLITENWFNSFIKLQDGSIGYMDEIYGENGYRRALRTIDFNTKSIGDAVDIPDAGWEIYQGGGEYELLISDYDNIYGFNLGDTEAVKILNWMQNDLISNNMQNITMLPDGRILCTSQIWNNSDGTVTWEILLLTKIPYSELPEKTIITLAAIYVPQNVGECIVRFNRNSQEYRILVIDYSQYNNEEDWSAGQTRLAAEIISGKIPDILCVSNLPYNEYAEKGLFADLYEFIDNDPEFSRSDFLEDAFRAAQIDGKLYQIFSSFYVQTLMGHPDIVGEGIGWNLDEFQAVMQAHPEADMPLGQWLTKMSFLQTSVALNMDNYINWRDGTVHFDTPEFIQLLENTNSLPYVTDWEQMGNYEYIDEEELVATGRQIMISTTVHGYQFYMYYKHILGGDIVFKGFPSENRKGNSLQVDSGLAMSANSSNKDGAWEFLRMTLQQEYQEQYNWWGFPTNKAVFDKQAQDMMNMQEGSHGVNGVMIEAPVQADVDNILALIASASGTTGWNTDQTVWEIISEEVAAVFAGTRSADDAARVIQSRVAMYVSERS